MSQKQVSKQPKYHADAFGKLKKIICIPNPNLSSLDIVNASSPALRLLSDVLGLDEGVPGVVFPVSVATSLTTSFLMSTAGFSAMNLKMKI